MKGDTRSLGYGLYRDSIGKTAKEMETMIQGLGLEFRIQSLRPEVWGLGLRV